MREYPPARFTRQPLTNTAYSSSQTETTIIVTALLKLYWKGPPSRLPYKLNDHEHGHCNIGFLTSSDVTKMTFLKWK